MGLLKAAARFGWSVCRNADSEFARDAVLRGWSPHQWRRVVNTARNPSPLSATGPRHSRWHAIDSSKIEAELVAGGG
jgi:hypothetical protein